MPATMILSPVDSAGPVQRALLLIFLLPRYPRVNQAATKDESPAPAPAAGAHRRRIRPEPPAAGA